MHTFDPIYPVLAMSIKSEINPKTGVVDIRGFLMISIGERQERCVLLFSTEKAVKKFVRFYPEEAARAKEGKIVQLRSASELAGALRNCRAAGVTLAAMDVDNLDRVGSFPIDGILRELGV